jgi:hypothetical protein
MKLAIPLFHLAGVKMVSHTTRRHPIHLEFCLSIILNEDV